MPTAAATPAQSSAVWGGIDRPYLVARPDDGAAQNAHAPWQFEVKLDTLAKALDADARTRVQPGPAPVAISVVTRDGAGRADRIVIDGGRGGATAIRTVRGDEFRQVLGRAFGARAIRSTMFEIGFRDRETMTFSGPRLRSRRRIVPGRSVRPPQGRRHARGRPALLLPGTIVGRGNRPTATDVLTSLIRRP